MEIRVEETLTGRAYLERILERYGSREALERAARRAGAHEARDDLLTVEVLEEEPGRLAATMTVSTVTTLSEADLERLTPKRLQTLDFLSRRGAPMNVSDLADALGRDKKNVSEDLQVLDELGLVDRVRRGREKLSRPLGNEIRIVLDAAA